MKVLFKKKHCPDRGFFSSKKCYSEKSQIYSCANRYAYTGSIVNDAGHEKELHASFIQFNNKLVMLNKLRSKC